MSESDRASYFDDWEVGQRYAAGPYPVTAEEIIEFAGRFDPQPFHMSEAAGAASIFGTLVASGIHTFAALNRLRVDAEARLGLKMLAGLGVDELRYTTPVRPGDRLFLETECLAKTPSASKPDRGMIRFRHRLLNQDRAQVMVADITLMIARRPA